MYLRIQLPVANSAYKDYPGLYAIKTIRLLSAGQEVYTCDFFQHMVDHLQQMKDEEVKDFATAYLGYEASLTITLCYRSCFSTASTLCARVATTGDTVCFRAILGKRQISLNESKVRFVHGSCAR